MSGRVIIGMDPHQRSATIEVLDEHEQVLAGGRFGTDRDVYQQLLEAGRRWPQRLWAVEGCQGVGRHLAQRLVADGEPVVDADQIAVRDGGSRRPSPCSACPQAPSARVLIAGQAATTPPSGDVQGQLTHADMGI